MTGIIGRLLSGAAGAEARARRARGASERGALEGRRRGAGDDPGRPRARPTRPSRKSWCRGSTPSSCAPTRAGKSSSKRPWPAATRASRSAATASTRSWACSTPRTCCAPWSRAGTSPSPSSCASPSSCPSPSASTPCSRNSGAGACISPSSSTSTAESRASSASRTSSRRSSGEIQDEFDEEREDVVQAGRLGLALRRAGRPRRRQPRDRARPARGGLRYPGRLRLRPLRQDTLALRAGELGRPRLHRPGHGRASHNVRQDRPPPGPRRSRSEHGRQPRGAMSLRHSALLALCRPSRPAPRAAPGGAGLRPGMPAALVAERREARFSEDWYSAIDDYLAAIAMNPSYGEAYEGLAECYYELGEYDQALSYVAKAAPFLKGDAALPTSRASCASASATWMARARPSPRSRPASERSRLALRPLPPRPLGGEEVRRASATRGGPPHLAAGRPRPPLPGPDRGRPGQDCRRPGPRRDRPALPRGRAEDAVRCGKPGRGRGRQGIGRLPRAQRPGPKTRLRRGEAPPRLPDVRLEVLRPGYRAYA